ncbi:serine hydroxymethyltransferase [Thecamonas trahens ATCC 50062]|uniref:Serine hydroxymethyltransferase n=1 Tax=Thecamonas trahens ATCC 50062 TaxID=461836 RepID=A0A0L0DF74_THETB|nr:serine hydroxymethyltransferase [Thecamonas trahens ATCC 50062]KNC49968.1 serine hydroxymethyltransferase [Thecamonas trahens ATCC 50062]|eukprot:XP_013757138.1 serine hydroxymethyltransferase [Thecamonas trahens ATCC 50062]
MSTIPRFLNASLEEVDPELAALVEAEAVRQWRGLELIASENFTSKAVFDSLGSCLTNKYSEGYPSKRYYGGNEVIDQVEELAQARALAAFGLDPEEWGVNVQAYSGSPANLAVQTALLEPHDRLMGLDLPSGGHLTHGFRTVNKKISASAIYFESLPYRINPETGLVNYDEVDELSANFMPKLLIAGGSAVPRDWDYARMRAAADKVKAYLMTDMAHYAGLVAAGVLASPFEHSHVVTTTTHKSLRGPRAALIFYRKRPRTLADGSLEVDPRSVGLEAKINFAVFPALQGGPHNNAIGAVATALKQAASDEFKAYGVQVQKNASALGAALVSRGHTLVTGGTDTHLVLWDVRPHGLTGSKLEKLFEAASITTNKNSIYGDKSAVNPGGIRLGTPALTSRGMTEVHMEAIAGFLDRGVAIALDIQAKSGKKLVDFVAAIQSSDAVVALKADVEALATQFPMPGFETADMTLDAPAAASE